MNSTEFYPDLERVVSIDCTESCTHVKGFHLYIEIDSNQTELLNDLAQLAQKVTTDKHNTQLQEIVYFSPRSFKGYHEDNGSMQRFSMRDALKMGKFQDFIQYVWKPNDVTSMALRQY